jgi:hypothetical protein
VELTNGFGLEIVGNRGRAVVLDGARELVDLTTEIHQIGTTFTLPQIYYRALFVHHALHLLRGREQGAGLRQSKAQIEISK